MKEEEFNCQDRGEHLARTIGVTNETAILLIINGLEIAYVSGQADYIKDLRRMGES